MENYLHSIMHGSRMEPSGKVLGCFNRAFPGVLNVEWFQSGDRFEVVFYQDDLEKIARFEKDGRLVDVKENLQAATLPDKIRKIASGQGEIMNSIRITKGSNLYYEFILRDRDLRRFTLLLDTEGDVLSQGYL